MFVTPIQIRPTFPLDAARIQQLKATTIWQTPRLLVLKAIAELVRPIGARRRKGIAAGFVESWQQLDQQLTAAAIRKMINDSNVEQDVAIRSMVRNLERAGKYQYSVSLGKLLLLKQHIEGHLHRDQKLTPRTSEIEQLVDSIAQEVCNEIQAVGSLDVELARVLTCGDSVELEALTERVKAAHLRIMRAYATLSETAQQLSAEQLSAAQPIPKADDSMASESSVLDRLVENLREENQVSKLVNDRIRSELPALDDV